MIKILIVDDSEIHLEGMKTILKRSESLNVTATAQTYDEAKQLLRKDNYDLAILDISLKKILTDLISPNSLKRPIPICQ